MSRHLAVPRPLAGDHDYWLCRCHGYRVDVSVSEVEQVVPVQERVVLRSAPRQLRGRARFERLRNHVAATHGVR